MRIRWKFLVVLLFISLVPMLLMRWTAQRSMGELGDDLLVKTMGALISRASIELKGLVEEHATILGRERDLVEMALQVQAIELEKRFAGGPAQNKTGHPLNAGESGTRRTEFRPSAKHLIQIGEMVSRPLLVSYEKQTYRIPTDINKEEYAQTIQKVSTMLPVYRKLERKHSDLILWQLTTFTNGILAVYPSVLSSPMKHGTPKEDWYLPDRRNKQIIWSKPYVDIFTMQIVFTVSKPFYRPDGSLIGVTAIVVPVDALLRVDEHIRRLSKDVTLLLVRTDTKTSAGKSALRILARGQLQKKMHHHWRAVKEEEWLEITNRDQREKLLGDLQSHKTGVRKISYKGQQSLAAYGCIDDYCNALLLIVPQKDLVAEAVNIGSYVISRIRDQITITRILLGAVVLAVIALSMVFSRVVTGNISRLADAALRVASGDFTARVSIRSKDEMGELGRTFNSMVPELEERVKMKQALDVAMEVQQNLLPQKIPKIKGLDIAGRSIYCDETGGDLYDFLEVCCRDSDQIGIAVGDVSGHGISAALLMASVRAFLRSRVTQPGEASEIITGVNRLLVNDTSETGQFVTLFYVEIVPDKKTLTWVRAGHDPAFFYDPTSDKCIELQGKGVALGIDEDIEYHENIKTDLTKGQILMIGTDGLWETQNNSGEMFGKERLKALIRQYKHVSSEELIQSIIDSLKAFQGSVRQEDDITVVVVKIAD
jgi:sigma-B regulation protein RsbU (phosphoserine phosphatase)